MIKIENMITTELPKLEEMYSFIGEYLITAENKYTSEFRSLVNQHVALGKFIKAIKELK